MTKKQTRRRLVLWAVLLALCLCACSAPFPKLEAAGFSVTEEEYLRAMYQARNDVLSDHAAAGISLTDWSAETALGDPCALVTDRAIEIICEYYAVATLAVERGYLADAGYDAMLEDLEEVNQKRQEAMDSGGILTGFTRFSLEDYLTYRASSLRLRFCGDSANPENQVTAGDILRRYEADKDSLYRQPDDLDLAFVVIDGPPEEAPARKAELEELRRRALELGGLAAALVELPLQAAHYEEISVDPASYSVYARSHGDILARAEGLRTGELSQVIEQEGWLCLVECRNRVEHTYRPLEEVESIVVQSIRESRYDALIAGRMEAMEIDTDPDALYRFTAEQFQ